MSFDDEIIKIIHSEANNNPPPLLCTITQNYADLNYVDVRLNQDKSIIKHVLLIGDNTVGNLGVLIFINGDADNMLVISK